MNPERLSQTFIRRSECGHHPRPIRILCGRWRGNWLFRTWHRIALVKNRWIGCLAKA